VTHVTEAQKAALDVEVAAKEQLRETLDECRQQAKRDKMMQLSQVAAAECTDVLRLCLRLSVCLSVCSIGILNVTHHGAYAMWLEYILAQQ